MTSWPNPTFLRSPAVCFSFLFPPFFNVSTYGDNAVIPVLSSVLDLSESVLVFWVGDEELALLEDLENMERS